MNTIHELLEIAIDRRASDLIVKAGSAPALRVNGKMEWTGLPVVTPEYVEEIAQQIIFSSMRDTLLQSPHLPLAVDAAQDKEGLNALLREGEWSGAFSIPCLARVHASLNLQRGTIGANLHLVSWDAPTLDEIGAPPSLKRAVLQERGLILLTGLPNSGVTTTKAALIEEINRHSARHIVSVEDRIEFVFTDQKSVIQQQELGKDTPSVTAALQGLLRYNPDVIVLDLNRDTPAIDVVVDAARAGHLVIAALYAPSIDEALVFLCSRFAETDRNRVRQAISDVLLCAVTHRLAGRHDGAGMAMP